MVSAVNVNEIPLNDANLRQTLLLYRNKDQKIVEVCLSTFL